MEQNQVKWRVVVVWTGCSVKNSKKINENGGGKSVRILKNARKNGENSNHENSNIQKMRRRFNSFPKRSNENAKHVLRQLIPIKCSHRVQGKVGASRSLNLTPELFRQSAPDAHAKTVTVRSGPSPFFGIQIKIFTDRRSEVAPRDRAFACVRPEHGAGTDVQSHAHRVLQVRSDH